MHPVFAPRGERLDPSTGSGQAAGELQRTARRVSPQTQAVETVEKVPFRKLIFGKWDKNIEKRLVFCLPNNILAIFEPVVGDFCEDFSSKEFFDSLVGRL